MYSKTASWNGSWGPREQLLTCRHERLVEVFSDVSLASSAGYKSTTGIAIFVTGGLVAWSSGTQPFVTQSTAESELVGLSEAHCCGRAIQALVNELLTDNKAEVILYGDNQAAISMTTGAGGSSWRTRRLRIRAGSLT